MNRMTRKEWLLLSRYLDGDLSEEQRQRTEKRLQADAAFKAAYERMLHTRQVLRSVPQRRIPHFYTLNEAQVRSSERRAAPQLFFQYSSAVAAVVAVLALAVQLFLPRAAAIPVAYDAVQPEMMLQDAPMEESVATATPPIIIWNPSYAAGKGGGGGGDDQTYTVIQPTPETSTSGWGLGGGGVAPENAAPLEEMAPMAEESLPETVPAEKSMQTVTETAPNPILGIAPQAKQGSVQAKQSTETELIRSAETKMSFSLNPMKIAIVSGLIAVICGIVALVLRKKKH